MSVEDYAIDIDNDEFDEEGDELQNFIFPEEEDETEELKGSQVEALALTSSFQPMAASRADGLKRDTITILRLKKFPEIKVWQKEKCKKIFGTKVCWGDPRVSTRKCNIAFVVDLTYPDVSEDISTCFATAVAAAAAAFFTTGGAAAAAAFKNTFITCLEAKGIEAAGKVSARGIKKKSCSDWS